MWWSSCIPCLVLLMRKCQHLAKQDNCIIQNSLSIVQKVLRREGKPKMISEQLYLLYSPCYQSGRGLPGCFGWEKANCMSQSKTQCDCTGDVPREAECVWQNQCFHCGVKLWFRDCSYCENLPLEGERWPTALMPWDCVLLNSPHLSAGALSDETVFDKI